MNENELDDIIDEFDEDESGEIEFAEFLKLASRFVEPEEDYDTLRFNFLFFFLFLAMSS